MKIIVIMYVKHLSMCLEHWQDSIYRVANVNNIRCHMPMLLCAFSKCSHHCNVSCGDTGKARCFPSLVKVASFIHGVHWPRWTRKYKENGDTASSVLEELEDGSQR